MLSYNILVVKHDEKIGEGYISGPSQVESLLIVTVIIISYV